MLRRESVDAAFLGSEAGVSCATGHARVRSIVVLADADNANA